MARGPCVQCPRRDRCTEPCERLRAHLDGPDRGRPAAALRRDGPAEVRALLALAPELDARTHAIVQLYYGAGFTMERIAQGMGLTRGSVCRRIQTAWRKLARRHTAARRR